MSPHSGGDPVRRWPIIVGALACVALVVVLVTVLGSSPKGSFSPPPSAAAKATAQRVIKQASQSGNASTLVATLHGPVPGSTTPGGAKTATVPGSWLGAPSELPVIAQEPGYLEVRLAQRPNGSTAWIPAADATLSATPYRIVVDLGTEHLMLYKGGNLVLTAPAGIGTVQDPTPTGDFFVAFDAKPPSSDWGAFIMVTSGHSNAISDWEQSGDAIMAIHGPLGADAAIGTTGARVSHGCVRLHEADLIQLQGVVPGSPVQVVS
jgi:lipoprotein-anchoring transpeptidase ErfK/SrfK